MIDTLHPQDPAAWARLHFAGASLGDVRRTQRVRTIASALAQNPAQSIPQLFADPYAVSRPPIPSSTARRLPPNVYRQRAPGVGPGAIEGAARSLLVGGGRLGDFLLGQETHRRAGFHRQRAGGVARLSFALGAGDALVVGRRCPKRRRQTPTRGGLGPSRPELPGAPREAWAREGNLHAQ